MKCKKWLFSKNVRFRFHSLLIENIENEFGFSFFLTLSMLLAFLFFLAIVLIFPLVLKDQEDDDFCGDGHLWEAHGAFFCFLLLLTLFEGLAVRSIKRRLKDQPLLFPLSNCSVLWKLGTSALSRADLYTDVCLLAILH